MAIEERHHYELARVVFFDARRGTGHAITLTGRKVRIPLGAVREAGVITLDAGDQIFVCVDEHDRTRVDRLCMPDPAAEKQPLTKKK
jgi:hypothetical protein